MKRVFVAVSLVLAAAAAAGSEGAATGSVGYWTTGYAGEDLTSGKFDCKPPAIPAYSKTNADIAATGKAIDEWQACYNGFVDNMNDAMPPGKRIPADVQARMTPAELEQARAHLNEVYGKVIAQAQQTAEATLAKRAAWQLETNKYIAEQNRQIAMQNEARKRELEADLRRAAEGRSMNDGHGASAVAPPSGGK